MKVTVCSREAIEKMITEGGFPQNAAVISFCDPGDTRVDFGGVCSDVFCCELDDLDREELSEKGYSYERFFPEAADLAVFVGRAHRDGKDIICQCEYGQSRSAGCAAAILEHFYRSGIYIFADERYYPNRVIYHKVFDALKSAF